MYYIGRGGGDCLCYCILLVYIILSSALSFSEPMYPLVIEFPAAIILKELQPFGFQHELRAYVLLISLLLFHMLKAPI